MPRAGGQSTATGVTFQGLAVARAMVDVHQGLADFVRPEAPPHVDLGGADLQKVTVDDFIVQREGRRTYYQAKSNAPSGGNWTPAKLADENILRDFRRQIGHDPNAECCLVTPCPCMLLGEISNRARAATSFTEFSKNLTDEQRRTFGAACRKLRVRQTDGYDLLQRCRLEIRTLEGMHADLLTLANHLFADAVSAVDSLHSLAVQAMGSGQQLDGAILQTQFSQRSVFARPKAGEKELLQAVQKAGAQLRSVGQDIDGVHVIQPVVSQILDWVAQEASRTTSIAALLDRAGSGKSVTLAVLLHRLEETGHTVLGIKVDKLTFASHEELAECLHLPALIPSVVQHLTTAGTRVVVLIDQVDALSSAMSRRPEAINVILDLVAQLGRLQQVPVVLACRLVDWRYDHRIQALQEHHPKEFALPELTDEQIDAVLSAKGLQCKDLHALTIKVIRRPLHLGTLVKVINGRRRRDAAWSPVNHTIYTLQSLYQDLWSLKMSKAGEPGGPGAATCETVITGLAQRMQQSQQLVVPEAAVASQRPAVEWLASEGILERHDKTVGMFHQTFFDFTLARHFVGSGISLVEHLVGTDQGLFYRPMVRQVLEYLRDVDMQGYLRTLRTVLTDARLRKHLRWVATAWLAQTADPTEEERIALEPLLSEPKSRSRVLSYMNGNAAWFDRIGLPRWKYWLEALPEDQAYNIVWFLRTILPLRQAAVAGLLAPYVGRNLTWNRAVAFCLSDLEHDWEDQPAALLFRLVEDPQAELDAEHPWWAHALENLAKSRPTNACQILGAVLSRFEPRWAAWRQADSRQKRGLLSPDEERLFPRAYGFQEAVTHVAEKSPTAFLDAVLDWTLRCMDIACEGQDDLRFRYDWHRIWTVDDRPVHRSTGALMVAIASACRALAARDPAACRRHMGMLLRVKVQPAQRLVAQTYASQPAEYATDAAIFLSSDPRRFLLGTSANMAEDTVDLLKACGPYWSDNDFHCVEQAVLHARLERLREPFDLHWRGHRHLQLLSALDRQRLSGMGRNLLGQLERKFSIVHSRPVEVKRRGLLSAARAPVPQASQAKMDDASWLSAMRHYEAPRSGPEIPVERRGGRLEMAQALKEHAKQQPDRFIRLALEQMDDSYHPDYIAAILEGAAGDGTPIEDIQRVVLRFRPTLEQQCIRRVADAISKYAESAVPEDLVQLLKHWSLHAEDPFGPRRGFLGTPGRKSSADLVDEGINTDRGSALWHLAKVLLLAKPPRHREYLDVAQQVIGDPSMAVRAVCIRFLARTLPEDGVRACRLFRSLAGRSKEQLRQSDAYDFVYHSLARHAKWTLWAIKAMLADRASEQAREAGAKLACLAAFEYPSAAPLRDKSLAGDTAVRKGAAAVYAGNVSNLQVGAECRQRLRALLDDENQEVRAAAATFLRDRDESDLLALRDLIRGWAGSKSVEDGAEDAARLLEQYPLVDPQLTLDLAERFIQVIGSPIADIRTRHGGLSHHLAPPVLNVYHKTTDAVLRHKAMDLFEQLDELGCPQVKQVMEAVDRV